MYIMLNMRTVPQQLPPFSLMVDDCGQSVRTIARYLGVTDRTVKRWLDQDAAPRAAMLALFFCTRWGRSWINCDAENHAQLAHIEAAIAASQLKKERERCDRAVINAFMQGELFASTHAAESDIADQQPLPAFPESPIA